jgi:predicted oxidoreductase
MLFGEALGLAPGLRRRLQLITTCGIKRPSPRRAERRLKSYDTSRAHIVDRVEDSLRAC